ncbi:YfgM family protein [Luteimonas aquatica]|uniref:YfgM family protein n=1 Tax=Luteimonas aquatica TaxID=450364 RepID=UPI001F5A0E9C|nr:tetratricopeptide repeat protein [Luteimonas aquatica]
MAIDDLLDEHEQSERVLSWLRRNGLGLIGGVVLGLGLIGGWQWWKARAVGESQRAGEQYQAALKAVQSKDLKQAQAQLAALKDTPYGVLYALDLAKAQLNANQRDAAIATLRAASTEDPGLQNVRNQRLARLLIDAGKAQEALQALGGADDVVSLEVRGDAQVALGKRDDARKSYGDALTKLDVAAPQRGLLELKLTDVGGKPAAKPEART